MEVPANPFDALANGYDASFTGGAVGTLMRQAVWRRLDAWIPSNGRVLDLGCGTGEDAVHLARRGCAVLAVDAAPAMVRLAQAKAESKGLSRLVEVRLGTAEDLPEGNFAGVVSNFGVLNCVEDLGTVATGLSERTRPGAKAALCLMGPLAPWEWFWFLRGGDFRRAFRRLQPGGAHWRGIHVHYPSIGRVRRLFAPWFRLRRLSGIGVLIPPPYAGKWLERRPALLEQLFRWERTLECVRPFPWLADHYLLELERV